MFVVSNLVSAIAWVLKILLTSVMWILIINALLSWVRPDPSNPIVRFLDQVSDAVCEPIRRLIPTVIGGLDLAPLIAIVILQVLNRVVVESLMTLSFRLG